MSWELFSSHRRSNPEPCARGAARRRRTDAGEEFAAHGALPEGSRHLRAVQYQRHRAQREERPRADRSRARRVAGLVRRRQRQILQRHSRQELFQSHPQERARLPRPAGARGPCQAARVGLADRACAKPSSNCRNSCASRRRPAFKEVYLQRLVFFEENAIGKARPDQALYEQLSREEASHIDRADRARRIARHHFQRLRRRLASRA